ncbi:MAG: MFS transporter, partial [Acutalibacteraceae bacterium]|nr:MFS transporter [Acutalibacteraceae bacterium]
MKLNYKRIFCVGFAFFLICAFWQAYDTLIPKILTDKFGLSQSLSGVIMAMDNVLALFLLPFFGSLSDRHNGKRGKRTPFILTGTILAAVLFITLSYGDYMQLNNISAVKNGDKASLSALYDQMEGKELKTPDGKAFVLSEDNKDGAISKAEFIEITPESDEHTEFVVPARQSYAWQTTLK